MNNTYYCVWWPGEGLELYEQLVGICITEEDALAIINKCKDDDLYFTEEVVNGGGEIL